MTKIRSRLIHLHTTGDNPQDSSLKLFYNLIDGHGRHTVQNLKCHTILFIYSSGIDYFRCGARAIRHISVIRHINETLNYILEVL